MKMTWKLVSTFTLMKARKKFNFSTTILIRDGGWLMKKITIRLFASIMKALSLKKMLNLNSLSSNNRKKSLNCWHSFTNSMITSSSWFIHAIKKIRKSLKKFLNKFLILLEATFQIFKIMSALLAKKKVAILESVFSFQSLTMLLIIKRRMKKLA